MLNFRSDIQDLKDRKNVDVIWIDFGKQHTKVEHYDPADNETVNREMSINFKGH